MIRFLFLCFIALFLSCNTNKEKPLVNKTQNNLNIVGSWKLIYADVLENDSLQVKEMGDTEFIKIINDSHFAFFNMNVTDSDSFMAGGGSYTLMGDNYTEKLDFFKNKDYRGETFHFTVEMKGDTLIQHGLEEIKEANIKRYIIEKYLKVN